MMKRSFRTKKSAAELQRLREAIESWMRQADFQEPYVQRFGHTTNSWEMDFVKTTKGSKSEP